MDSINFSSTRGSDWEEEEKQRRQPDAKVNSSEVNDDMKRKTAWGEANGECNGGGGETKKQRIKTSGDDNEGAHFGRQDGENASPSLSDFTSGGSVDKEDEDSDEEEGDDGDDAEPTSNKKDPFSIKGACLDSLSPDDKARFLAADKRRREDSKILIGAFTRLVSLKAELQRCQQKVEEAQGIYENVSRVSVQNAINDADDLLLEPTHWNDHYNKLVQFYEREGHSNFKRTITFSDVEGMPESEAKEVYNMSWWTCRQRKFKRRGDLEEYKIQLLNRVKFNWDPHSGPGPEKWLKNYGLLKKFKEKHGHVRVPFSADDKLGSWLKTQVTQYRNTQEYKLPALSAERIQLLEDIGVDWGERRGVMSWEERFLSLLDYRQRFGHVNVPWQWKENIPLSQWVNSQRKKYKDLIEGRKNNLTDEQIDRLNSIGFKWNTGGKGRFMEILPNAQGDGMSMASLYHPGVLTPFMLPSSVVPVFPIAEHASIAMWPNFLSPGVPAEYANYVNRMTYGVGNQDQPMYHPQQPQLQCMIPFAYNQINRPPGEGSPLP